MTKERRSPKRLTLDQVQNVLGMSQQAAANYYGIHRVTLKRNFSRLKKELRLERWPSPSEQMRYRISRDLRRKLNRLIRQIEAEELDLSPKSPNSQASPLPQHNTTPMLMPRSPMPNPLSSPLAHPLSPVQNHVRQSPQSLPSASPQQQQHSSNKSLPSQIPPLIRVNNRPINTTPGRQRKSVRSAAPTEQHPIHHQMAPVDGIYHASNILINAAVSFPLHHPLMAGDRRDLFMHPPAFPQAYM